MIYQIEGIGKMFFFRCLIFIIYSTGLLSNLFSGTINESGKLHIATCQFPVSSDISANANWIQQQMQESKQQGADIVHFPECALSGYAGVDYQSFDNFDWIELREQTKAIVSLADELDLWVILGSTHRLSEGNKPHNSLYIINSEGQIIDRYDKRFCTKMIWNIIHRGIILLYLR